MKTIRKKRIFLSLLCVLILVLCLVSCNDHSEIKVEIVGNSPVELAVGEVVTDEILTSGVKATVNESSQNVTIYVVDKNDLDVSKVGEYTVVLGVKLDGEIVYDRHGAVTCQRKVTVRETFYADVKFSCASDLYFVKGQTFTSQTLLDGCSVSEGFSLYVRDETGLNVNLVGTYCVYFGVKKQDKIVKKDGETELIFTRKIVVSDSLEKDDITFYFNDEIEQEPVYIQHESGVTQPEILEEAISGVSAKDDDFNSYDVQIVGSDEIDSAVIGEYNVTIGAFYNNQPVISNGQKVEVCRKVVVKQFEKLSRPENVSVGEGKNVGCIVFDNPPNAQSFTVKIVNLGQAYSAEAVAEIDSQQSVVPLGFCNLPDGDYTVFVNAHSKGFADSDYSEGCNVEYKVFASYSANDIAVWQNSDHGEPSFDKKSGTAKITTTRDGWGKAKSGEFSLDYSLNPLLALDIYKVDSAYFATLFVDKTEIKIIDDTRKNLPVTATIPKGGNNEIVKAALIVGPTGGGPSVYIRSARVFALNAVDQAELNRPLETPQNMRLGDNGYSVTWNAIKKCAGYSVLVKKYAEQTVVASDVVTENSFAVANLPVGQYTIEVMAKGKPPYTVDSSVATFSFSVNSYAMFNAQQISSFSNSWHSAKVAYDKTTDRAVFNHSGNVDYGAVGCNPVNVDLSRKPVAVLTDVFVKGGFLARGYFGSSKMFVMQHDTVPQSQQGQSYANIFKPLWIDADGNLIPEASGTIASPQGKGDYSFMIGFCKGKDSRVSVKSLSIVYLEAI